MATTSSAVFPVREDELKQLDDQIDRNRFGRQISVFVAPPLFLLLAYLLGSALTGLIGVPTLLGELAGIAGGASAAVWAHSRSWIENNTTAACITHDPVRSFFNKNPLVCYGPGKHPCYFWEGRVNGNTVHIGEVTEPFTTEVHLAKGSVVFSGSIRFRARITELHKFVSGAGAVAADIKGLVIAFILKELGGGDQPIQEVLRCATSLNAKLDAEFKHGNGSPVSEEFEGRFGLIVGDITVEKVEAIGIEETLNALSEAAIIDQIVANSFGCKDAKALQRKIEQGKISAQEARHRRNQTMAHSGNLQGMAFEDKNINFNVTGIDPALAQALIEGAPVLAVASRMLAGGTKGSHKPKGGAKPRGERT